MKYATSTYSFSAQLLLVCIITCAGCNCGGTTTAGNSVSVNGKVSMTVSANPITVKTNGTTTVTATVTNLQRDGVTWQPANGARVVFRLRPYPGHACGDLVGGKTIQTDANGDAKITFKASNAPTTSGGDTCFVWVVADRTFSVGTDSNVSDSVTLKIY